jgi:hypothetical protein
METEFITAIWLVKLDKVQELTEYIEWKYSSDDNVEPTSKFAVDSELISYDVDFLESAFLDSTDKVLTTLENFSYIEYYKDNLFEKINSLDISDKNSIIAITGKRSINGDINSQLFDGNFTTTDEKKLQFVGAYKYIMTE